jgi:uncharacterized protein (UPF0147 family)
MTKSDFIKEWEHTVGFNAIEIISFQQLMNDPHIADEFYTLILNIFKTLSRLKHGKFYTKKELDTVFYLVKEDIYSINDLLMVVNDKALPSNIYEVVYNIFEELLILCEDQSLFETCQNLLNFRDIWFSHAKVKIIQPSAKK